MKESSNYKHKFNKNIPIFLIIHKTKNHRLKIKIIIYNKNKTPQHSNN